MKKTNGKGDSRRPYVMSKWDDNYGKIKWNKGKSKVDQGKIDKEPMPKLKAPKKTILECIRNYYIQSTPTIETKTK